MNRTAAFLTCLVGATTLAQATTIGFVGAATSINDGAYYVLPYQITINGVNQLVDCYDVFDEVKAGDTWQANILTISQAATSGYFAATNALADYEEIAWLSAQTYTNSAQQVGLQHAMWNVFGSVADTPESKVYEAAVTAAAAAGYSGFDFTPFRFIQQAGGVAGTPGLEQAFVYEVATTSTNATGTPEPGTMLLFIPGVALILFGRRLRSH